MWLTCRGVLIGSSLTCTQVASPPYPLPPSCMVWPRNPSPLWLVRKMDREVPPSPLFFFLFLFLIFRPPLCHCMFSMVPLIQVSSVVFLISCVLFAGGCMQREEQAACLYIYVCACVCVCVCGMSRNPSNTCACVYINMCVLVSVSSHSDSLI